MTDINKIAKDMTTAFGIEPLKNKIVSGINTATEKLGVKLVNEEWGSKNVNSTEKWDCACALGCMLVANNLPLDPEDTDFNEITAADYLGVDKAWVDSFITGFDSGFQNENCKKYPEAYQLGTELRIQYNVKTASQIEDEEELDEDDE